MKKMSPSCHCHYNVDGTSYIYCLFYCRTRESCFNFYTNPSLELHCLYVSEKISQYLMEYTLFTAQEASRKKIEL